MIPRLALIALSVAAGTSTASCQTTPSGEMTNAVLMATDEASMTAVKAAAGEIVGRKNVELGVSDFVNSSAISVLPKRSFNPTGSPFNQQDFAIPTQLILMTDGTNCFLLKEKTGEMAQVQGVACRPLTQTQ